MSASANRPNLLLVDDEARILRSLAMLFKADYRVQATTDPMEALAIAARDPIHVIVSDQRMPVMRGAELLRRVRECSPQTMRLLLTGYSEMDAVIASVNEGEIFRYVSKPWNSMELRRAVEQAANIALDLFAGDGASGAVDVGTPPAVLVVDDDPAVIEVVRHSVDTTHATLWARSIEETFEMLARHHVGVIVAELSVGGEDFTTALKLLKSRHPEVVTTVLTPFQDIGVLIGLINQGQIFRLLPKPARSGTLGMNLASALRHHQRLRASSKLRASHAVETPQQTGDGAMANRVMGLLSRIRAYAGNNAGG